MDTLPLLLPLEKQNLSSNSHLNLHILHNINEYIQQYTVPGLKADTWSYNISIFLDMELNHVPSFFVALTSWDVIDPYLVGGMPLFDLADLLTLGGDSIGLLDSLGSTGTSLTIDFSMDCTLS